MGKAGVGLVSGRKRSELPEVEVTEVEVEVNLCCVCACVFVFWMCV